MGSFIDRNPEQMMKYANEAREVIDEMIFLIRKVEGWVDFYSQDLDGPTQKQIAELHRCCSEYIKQIDIYRKVADDIYKNGRKLKDIRSEG